MRDPLIGQNFKIRRTTGAAVSAADRMLHRVVLRDRLEDDEDD